MKVFSESRTFLEKTSDELAFSQITYWKCNFPMTPQVRLVVVRSVIISKKRRKLHLHAPTGALTNFKVGIQFWCTQLLPNFLI